MSLDHTHDDVHTALAGEALDALSPEERQRLLDHVAECEACAAELAEWRESAALLAYLAPPRTLDADRAARMRSRLVARAAADRLGSAGAAALALRAAPRVREGSGRTAGSARWRGRTGWIAAAASFVLFCAAAGWGWSLRGQLDALAQRYAALAREHGALARGVEEREQTIAGLAGPGVRVIDLASTGARAPSGRMFWDAAAGKWTFFAHNLPAVREGRTYELWLITPGRKIPAGTFQPDAQGRARLQADYALPADSLRAIAVTEEPAGGVPQPTGEIVIVGAMSE